MLALLLSFTRFCTLCSGIIILGLVYGAFEDSSSNGNATFLPRLRTMADHMSMGYFNLELLSLETIQTCLRRYILPIIFGLHLLEEYIVLRVVKRHRYYIMLRTFICGFWSLLLIYLEKQMATTTADKKFRKKKAT